MSPDEFLDALCGDIDVVGIAIGTNFTFGAKEGWQSSVNAGTFVCKRDSYHC